ncbi:paxillin-like isoform X3 [Hydractinia symbiolongicarpus]|uniref:paxillin-like isoform X3 n=1 Tax=Hydractinia symbiolongicarpus TaxID=13093 RepID=UPI00254EE541|nr:paxillin-like isoform X3 [Hydractinia symbiolongicarpus]
MERKGSKKARENIEFLDALLADLQNQTSSRPVKKPAGSSSSDDFPPPPTTGLSNGDSSSSIDSPPLQVSMGAVEALLDELDSTVSHSKTVSHAKPVAVRATITDQPMPRTASTATKELDDLMASLSDFKVVTGTSEVDGPPRPPAPVENGMQSPTDDYAKIDKQPPKTRGSLSSQPPVNNLDSMLGSLQTNMSKQGVTTVTKGTCAACNKPIIGQVCTALGKAWHPEHFACCICDTQLGTKTFFERDGKPYCEDDYHEKFAPKCFACNGPILDSCVTSMDRTWHPEHFVCAECSRPFGDSGFHEKDGKAYCRDDYFKMFAPKCSGCNQAIIDNYISALNGHWHPQCFVCMECHQPFQNGSFFEHEGMPYCEMHYHARRGSLCYSCQKPITGRCITAMHRKFHPEHFICAFCLKQLNKGTFKEQNDKPYCHSCFVKLFA